MSFPGTKAQLKPSFVKKKGDKSEKKDKKKKNAEKEDEGDDTETEGRKKVNDWLRKGESAQAATTDSTLPIEPPTSVTDSVDATPQPDMPRSPEPEATQDGTAHGKHAGCVNDPDIPEGLEKMQLVVKWGGESTHSSRYQSRDLGDAFKKDIMIMSKFVACGVQKFQLTDQQDKDVLNNVKIYTSSERRVIVGSIQTTDWCTKINFSYQNTAQIFAHALLGVEGSSSSSASSIANARNPPEQGPQISHLIQRRDLLDDNNAAKDLCTDAKKKLKMLLRTGETERRPDLAWPKSFKKEPVEVVSVRWLMSSDSEIDP